MTILQCIICKSIHNVSHLYGIDCCNKCSMKHRSHCKKSNPIKNPRTYFGDSNCKFCISKRLQISSLPNSIVLKDNSMVKTLQEISKLDSRKERIYMSSFIKNDVSIESAITSSRIKFISKSENKILNFEEWSTINQLTTIDFFKNLHFVNNFSAEDRTIFIRGARFQCAILSTAFRCFKNKKECLELAENIDIFPDLTRYPFFTPEFINSIRCILVSKLIELNVSRDEFLLLVMVQLFLKRSPEMSESGIMILVKQRDIYASYLFQYCRMNDSINGHSRYVDLLSVCQMTSKTYDLIESFALLCRISTPNLKGNELIKFE